MTQEQLHSLQAVLAPLMQRLGYKHYFGLLIFTDL